MIQVIEMNSLFSSNYFLLYAAMGCVSASVIIYHFVYVNAFRVDSNAKELVPIINGTQLIQNVTNASILIVAQ